MIYSNKKWDDGQELKQHLKISTATSFAMMETPLRNAFETYLEPLLGTKMTERLIQIYESEQLDPETEETKVSRKLLAICQKANGNLAYFHDFDEINSLITDAGFQRHENDTIKSMYQYQEISLRESFRNKGFNGLDRMLEFLEKNSKFFPEFEKSDAYSFRKKSIVPDASYANRFYFINSSRIVFLRLLPHLDFAEQKFVRQTLGDELYKHFKEDMFEPDYEGEDKLHFEGLREAAARVIVVAAVRRLIVDGGNLTDRGMYFTGTEATTKSSTTSQKATGFELEMQLKQLEQDILDAVATLASVAKLIYPQSSAQNPRDAYNRNNNNRRTFFA